MCDVSIVAYALDLPSSYIAPCSQQRITPSQVTHNLALVTGNLAWVTHNLALVMGNLALVTHNSALVTSNLALVTHNLALVTSNLALVTPNLVQVTHNFVRVVRNFARALVFPKTKCRHKRRKPEVERGSSPAREQDRGSIDRALSPATRSYMLEGR